MRKQVGRIDEALLDRVDAEAKRLGQTRRVYIERAIRTADYFAGMPARFGAGMVPFDNAYRDALARGLTPAEAQRVGVWALIADAQAPTP